jgi:hypothetical protein
VESGLFIAAWGKLLVPKPKPLVMCHTVWWWCTATKYLIRNSRVAKMLLLELRHKYVYCIVEVDDTIWPPIINRAAGKANFGQENKFLPCGHFPST